MEKKVYVTCFKCRRDFEINKDDETGKMWGGCPVCKFRYKVMPPEDKRQG